VANANVDGGAFSEFPVLLQGVYLRCSAMIARSSRPMDRLLRPPFGPDQSPGQQTMKSQGRSPSFTLGDLCFTTVRARPTVCASHRGMLLRDNPSRKFPRRLTGQ
jgi:hypothetical protein